MQRKRFAAGQIIGKLREAETELAEGQLAGACWGESGIPVEWRKELARGDMIERALSGPLGG